MKSFWQNLIKNSNTSWKRIVGIIKSRDNFICSYCGRFDTRGEVDHILPLNRGGTDALYNLVWACKRCNREKGDKTLREWVKSSMQEERKEIIEMIEGFLDMYGDIPEKTLFGSFDEIRIGGRLALMWLIVRELQDKALLIRGFPEEILHAIKISEGVLLMLLSPDQKEIWEKQCEFGAEQGWPTTNAEAREAGFTRLDDDQLRATEILAGLIAIETADRVIGRSDNGSAEQLSLPDLT